MDYHPNLANFAVFNLGGGGGAEGRERRCEGGVDFSYLYRMSMRIEVQAASSTSSHKPGALGARSGKLTSKILPNPRV